MRATVALVLLLPLLISEAQGQVSVDMHALDAPGATQRSAPPEAEPARHPPVHAPVAPLHRTSAANRHSGTSTSTPGTAAAQKPAPSHATEKSGPGAPPTPVANAPVPALPTVQPAAPPPSTLVPAPKPPQQPLPPPVQLVFETGKTDLTPADEAAIQDLARAIPAPASESINVVAYAAGKPDDPSTARRLSLSRGLAVRSVLLASGVPSAQIYVRALGSTPSNGPADRVELTVAPIGTVTR